MCSDICAPTFEISRHITVLVNATADLHDLQRTVLLDPLLIRVNCAWESRLMKDALTIAVFGISRQQGQSVLDVGQDLRLKAGYMLYFGK